MEPRNRFQGIDPASLCSLAGRYDNPIPTRFLATIDCSKIPALNPFIGGLFQIWTSNIGEARESTRRILCTNYLFVADFKHKFLRLIPVISGANLHFIYMCVSAMHIRLTQDVPFTCSVFM